MIGRSHHAGTSNTLKARQKKRAFLDSILFTNVVDVDGIVRSLVGSVKWRKDSNEEIRIFWVVEGESWIDMIE